MGILQISAKITAGSWFDISWLFMWIIGISPIGMSSQKMVDIGRCIYRMKAVVSDRNSVDETVTPESDERPKSIAFLCSNFGRYPLSVL